MNCPSSLTSCGVVVQRGTGFVMLVVIGLTRREPWFASGVGRRYAMAAGALGLVAIASLQLAFRHGDLGPVSVASSQFATVAVILSVLFNHERMRWWQACGVAATALAVSLIVAWSNGREFDSSWNRDQTFTFRLGAREVIEGWDQGVKGMHVGGRRRLTIPPHMGYGDRGAGGVIKGGETLVFVVDLVAVH